MPCYRNRENGVMRYFYAADTSVFYAPADTWRRALLLTTAIGACRPCPSTADRRKIRRMWQFRIIGIVAAATAAFSNDPATPWAWGLAACVVAYELGRFDWRNEVATVLAHSNDRWQLYTDANKEAQRLKEQCERYRLELRELHAAIAEAKEARSKARLAGNSKATCDAEALELVLADAYAACSRMNEVNKRLRADAEERSSVMAAQ